MKFAMRNQTMITWGLLVPLAAALGGASAAYYDTFTGNQITDERVEALKANNLIPWCAVQVQDCDPHEPRRLDYSCNNLHHPQRGTILTPYYRMLPPNYAADGGLRVAKSGRPLPNARALRVAMVSDGRVPNKVFTHMITNLNVFMVGDISSVHDTFNYVTATTTCCLPGGEANPRCMPIKVPDDDVHLRSSNVRCLNLTRAITYQSLGCVPNTVPGERINTAPPMLELSSVYGNQESSARRIMLGKGGRLTSELIHGKEWPLNGSSACVNNVPPHETRCHNTEVTTNTLMPSNMVFLWLYRNHNYIADKLRKLNSCWDDYKLFTVAKDINIAMYQHILYYELMPAIIGHEYLERNKVTFPGHLHVDDYDETLEPQVALEYVLGIRWFHTLQEARIKLYDKHGKMFNQISVVDMILRTGALVLNHTLEGATQGAFRQPCASTDHIMDPEMGERVLGPLQFVSDVMAADIMKARDIGLPGYNRYRELCKLPVAKHFHDLYEWMPKDQVEAITAAYEDIDDVDLMAGMLGENAMPGAVMGPTLACIMTDQLLRWRRSDRFWYENTEHTGAFTPEQLREIKRITMARILCDHGDTVEAIQPNVFYLPGYGNEITDCSFIPSINFNYFKELHCENKHIYRPHQPTPHHRSEHHHQTWW